MTLKRCAVVGFAALLALIAGAIDEVRAEPLTPTERPSVATLPAFGEHFVWVPDRMLQHSLLYDGDSGEVLGMVDAPSLLTPKTPLLSRARGEIYSSDIAYSRGLRGERIDFVSIYDSTTLDYKAEVVLPTRAGTSNASLAYAEMIGDRFLGVFNQFPITSVSIVDLERRFFIVEIPITGCAGIYPVDASRFATLCANGTAHMVELDRNGHLERRASSPAFFDVVDDPVMMAGGRDGTRWFFVSFAGQVHGVDFSGEVPSVEEAWSLLDDDARSEDWRPGGLQNVALHAPTKRLYVVMHQGGPGTHKEAGPEIWVYDLEKRERIGRFELPNLTAAFIAPQIQVEPGSFVHGVLDWVIPEAGVHTIAVSQDDAPLLFARHATLGAVAVLDAFSGETLRVLTEAGLAGPTLRVP